MNVNTEQKSRLVRRLLGLCFTVLVTLLAMDCDHDPPNRKKVLNENHNKDDNNNERQAEQWGHGGN
jgi:hypothetical protein